MNVLAAVQAPAPVSPESRAVAYVLKGYPRLSETFIAQEIRALEQRGLDIRIVSLRHPTDRAVHPVNREIVAPLLYLPEYLYQEPRRVFAAWRALRRQPTYGPTFAAWLRDLRRDPTPNRIRRFGQALVLAHELARDVGWLHAHFLHTPASVARYAAMLRGLPWSVSAHAKDIWTTPAWEKREKLADCRWAVTCTAFNAEHLGALAPRADRVELVYHGLDLGRFPPEPRAASPVDGSDPAHPALVLSVGRAVAKKGFDVLLDALARLPAGLHWRLVHIGGGPLRKRLRRQAGRLGLADRIVWMGSQPQETVLAQYRRADLFVLPCRVDDAGDRDGLPNVLMEAQSQGLACLSTTVSAVPELIDDDRTGLLVPAEDVQALAGALARLIGDPALRARLGAAGQAALRERFSLDRWIAPLARRFGLEAPGKEGGTVKANADPKTSAIDTAVCASPSTHR